MSTAYSRLIALLDLGGARYRLLDHAPEGRTELVSAMRGNPLEQAAKCMVVMVKVGKKVTRHVLAVVPGDVRVDLEAVRRLLGGTYASFAARDVAERLAGAEAGTILPFSPSAELELVADPRLFEHDEMFFNAGRLDRSLALATADYLALARPRLERIGVKNANEGDMKLVQKVNVAEKFSIFSEHWSPKIIGEVNDLHIKAAKLQGEFVWHHHENEDELFYVVKGRLVIKLRDGDVVVEPGEFVVIPRTVEHLPVAADEVHVLLLEPKTTLNTGNVTNERTLETLSRL